MRLLLQHRVLLLQYSTLRQTNKLFMSDWKQTNILFILLRIPLPWVVSLFRIN